MIKLLHDPQFELETVLLNFDKPVKKVLLDNLEAEFNSYDSKIEKNRNKRLKKKAKKVYNSAIANDIDIDEIIVKVDAEYSVLLDEYKQSLSKKLDLEQAIDTDKKFVAPFECNICSFVVSEDMTRCMNVFKENDCEAIFCRGCIENWKLKQKEKKFKHILCPLC